MPLDKKPANLTIKQEKFAQKYVEIGNASEAYRQSYDAGKMKPDSINVNASKLLADAKVALRVKELKSVIVKRHGLTIDDILEELEEARQLELNASKPNTSSMVAATMGKAKVAGLIKDKQEITGPNGGPIDLSLSVSFIKPK